MAYFDLNPTLISSNGEEVEVEVTFEVDRDGEISIQMLSPDLPILRKEHGILDAEQQLYALAGDRLPEWQEQLLNEHVRNRRD